jgi:hypothetical protein
MSHQLGPDQKMVNTVSLRQMLRLHGTLRAQPASDWLGSIALPGQLGRFYWEIGPDRITINSYGNPYFLPSLAELWQFQAGYRWNSITGEQITDWDSNWIVVADQAGDPFIFSESGKILFAQHGEGDWNARELFTDVYSMAACLAILGSISITAGPDFTDAESYVRRQYMEVAEEELALILGPGQQARSLLAELGWASTPG